MKMSTERRTVFGRSPFLVTRTFGMAKSTSKREDGQKRQENSCHLRKRPTPRTLQVLMNPWKTSGGFGQIDELSLSIIPIP